LRVEKEGEKEKKKFRKPSSTPFTLRACLPNMTARPDYMEPAWFAMKDYDSLGDAEPPLVLAQNALRHFGKGNNKRRKRLSQAIEAKNFASCETIQATNVLVSKVEPLASALEKHALKEITRLALHKREEPDSSSDSSNASDRKHSERGKLKRLRLAADAAARQKEIEDRTALVMEEEVVPDEPVADSKYRPFESAVTVALHFLQFVSITPGLSFDPKDKSKTSTSAPTGLLFTPLTELFGVGKKDPDLTPLQISPFTSPPWKTNPILQLILLFQRVTELGPVTQVSELTFCRTLVPLLIAAGYPGLNLRLVAVKSIFDALAEDAGIVSRHHLELFMKHALDPRYRAGTPLKTYLESSLFIGFLVIQRSSQREFVNRLLRSLAPAGDSLRQLDPLLWAQLSDPDKQWTLQDFCRSSGHVQGTLALPPTVCATRRQMDAPFYVQGERALS
jgi:hypothetical protein